MTDVTPPPPSPPSSPGGSSGGTDYPIHLEYNRDYDVQNWRPLVNWLLAIPHWIVLYLLGIVAFVLWFISLFIVLFTQRNPFVGFQTMYLRYYWRVSGSSRFSMGREPPPALSPAHAFPPAGA